MKSLFTLPIAIAGFVSTAAVAQVTPITPIDPTITVTPVGPAQATHPVTPIDPNIIAQIAQAAATALSTAQVVGSPGTPGSTRAWVVLGRAPNQQAVAVATPVGGSGTNPPPPTARTYVSDGQYVNFSMRGTVAGTAQPVITGFAVAAGQKVTLLRAVGPTLSSFGVTGALANPRLELFDHNGQRIALAVAWGSNTAEIRNQIKVAVASTGAFPLSDTTNDAVLLAVLDAGTYTCVVTAPDGTSGQVLLEGYDVTSAVITP